ncbi:MAG: hypothetical protein A3J47_02075 [Candidatus Yanofskybacteria bacterium RIFCSPHIGHO2_02_FULL_43_22]|uniref:Uncharacterized protein n=1 Tax=Candidatus Yanofskybacteria bacterium RIFCSPHIGHO2_02_FULL_43_22 TaxID=1802681 RepID=A0A1F8FP19_9BACT|nr:MAG: hypothetical protein A3J47_02075 [Candidatus Yanofskybacteria bacterium RIFCSPHIGHO2_02_FULL_43_22]
MTDRQPTNRSVMILMVVVAFAIGYLFYSQSIQPTQLPIDPPPLSAKDDLAKFKDLTINFLILDDSRFKELRVFGESPVKPGVTGKRDIFAPF